MSAISGSDESDSDDEKPKKLDRFARMEQGFIDQFTSAGTNLMMFGAQADGLVIINRAQPLAHKLTNVARQNPAVYKALKRYLDGSVYAMLAEEMIVIGGAICLNHGINPVQWVKDLFKKREADGNADLPAVA